MSSRLHRRVNIGLGIALATLLAVDVVSYLSMASLPREGDPFRLGITIHVRGAGATE